MEIDKPLITAIAKMGREIADVISKRDTATITFRRPRSITTIRKSEISSVHVSDNTVRIVTTNGAEAFYTVVERDSNTDYLNAVAELRNHGYSIPSFADLAPTAK